MGEARLPAEPDGAWIWCSKAAGLAETGEADHGPRWGRLILEPFHCEQQTIGARQLLFIF